MNLDKAMNRIIWRFEKFDTIFVNETDIEAINKIVEYINTKETLKINDNIYFLKLYTYALSGFIEKYNTTIDNDFPHIQLHKLLNRPLGHFIEDITSQTNFRFKNKILEAAGCNLNKHPATISNYQKEMNLSALKDLMKMGDNKNICN